MTALVCVAETHTLDIAREIPDAHGEGVYSVRFSSDCTAVVSCSNDKVLKVWNAGVGALPTKPLARTDHSCVRGSDWRAQG